MWTCEANLKEKETKMVSKSDMFGDVWISGCHQEHFQGTKGKGCLSIACIQDLTPPVSEPQNVHQMLALYGVDGMLQ